MAESSDYRLVLFDAPEDPQAVRDLLCGVTGIHPTDAMQWIARAPGTFPKPLSAGESRELLDGLYELGVAAEAWRTDTFPQLSPPRTAHDVSCLPEGFRVKGLRGEPTHWIPWDRVELVCAGKVATEDEFREVAPVGWVQAVSTGLNAILRRPQMIARRRRSIRIPHDPVGEVILVRSDPRIALRMVETKMTYSYLGTRLKPSAAENFPLFVSDLCLLAEQAYIPASTRNFVKGENPETFMFESSQALVDYATHRLLWSWYRRARDEGKRTAADD